MDIEIPKIFAQTVPEAALWSQGVFYQSAIADVIISYKILPIVISLVWVYGLAKLAWQASKQRQFATRTAIFFTIKCWVFAALGIGLLSLKSSTPFNPMSYNNVEWSSYSNNSYLNNNSNRPIWSYVIIHKAYNEIADLFTDVIVRISGEKNYNNNVDSVFQTIVDSSTQNIDDPNIKNDLDILAAQCRNKGVQKITGVNESFASFFDLTQPKCADQFEKLNNSLKFWARNKIKTDSHVYFNAMQEQPSLASSFLIKLGLLDSQKYENKIIASALVNYARQRSGLIVDVDHDALLGKISNADVYADISAATDFDYLLTGIAKFFAGQNTDVAIVRNNLARQYNSMLAWIPGFRGMCKAFIAVMFLVALIAFSFGFTKLIMAWLCMVFWFTLYMPLSALSYMLTMSLFVNGNSIKAIASVGSDPFSLSAASSFDAHASQYMVAYFMAQIAILSFTSIFGLIDLFKGTTDKMSSTVVGTIAKGAIAMV